MEKDGHGQVEKVRSGPAALQSRFAVILDKSALFRYKYGIRLR